VSPHDEEICDPIWFSGIPLADSRKIFSSLQDLRSNSPGWAFFPRSPRSSSSEEWGKSSFPPYPQTDEKRPSLNATELKVLPPPSTAIFPHFRPGFSKDWDPSPLFGIFAFSPEVARCLLGEAPFFVAFAFPQVGDVPWKISIFPPFFFFFLFLREISLCPEPMNFSGFLSAQPSNQRLSFFRKPSPP